MLSAAVKSRVLLDTHKRHTHAPNMHERYNSPSLDFREIDAKQLVKEFKRNLHNNPTYKSTGKFYHDCDFLGSCIIASTSDIVHLPDILQLGQCFQTVTSIRFKGGFVTSQIAGPCRVGNCLLRTGMEGLHLYPTPGCCYCCSPTLATL